jgi:hypothetical protein
MSASCQRSFERSRGPSESHSGLVVQKKHFSKEACVVLNASTSPRRNGSGLLPSPLVVARAAFPV